MCAEVVRRLLIAIGIAIVIGACMCSNRNTNRGLRAEVAPHVRVADTGQDLFAFSTSDSLYIRILVFVYLYVCVCLCTCECVCVYT